MAPTILTIVANSTQTPSTLVPAVPDWSEEIPTLEPPVITPILQPVTLPAILGSGHPTSTLTMATTPKPDLELRSEDNSLDHQAPTALELAVVSNSTGEIAQDKTSVQPGHVALGNTSVPTVLHNTSGHEGPGGVPGHVARRNASGQSAVSNVSRSAALANSPGDSPPDTTARHPALANATGHAAVEDATGHAAVANATGRAAAANATGRVVVANATGVALTNAPQHASLANATGRAAPANGTQRQRPGNATGDLAPGNSTKDNTTLKHALVREPKGICNETMPKLTLAPRSPWVVPSWASQNCYHDMMRQYSSSDPRLATQDEHSGRRWCWVAMKEYACHTNLFVRPRPHLSWKEMGWRAAWIVPQPQPPMLEEYKPLDKHELCDRRELGQQRSWTSKEWAESWAWFTEHVTVYAVNLKSNKERWQALHQRLDEMHIKHKRVWGVDMREEDALQKAKHEGLIPADYDYHRAQDEASKPYHGMGGIMGTVGCASAHFRAQTTAYREAKTPLALVFEDDVRPVDDFVPRLWKLVRGELPCDWQVLTLRSMCPFGTCVSEHLTRVQPDVNEPADRCRHGVNYGFQGVLYRLQGLEELQQRWKRVVFNESRPHCLDVDVALASMSDSVGFYAVPFVQYPGFLTEVQMTSSRFSINQIKT